MLFNNLDYSEDPYQHALYSRQEEDMFCFFFTSRTFVVLYSSAFLGIYMDVQFSSQNYMDKIRTHLQFQIYSSSGYDSIAH